MPRDLAYDFMQLGTMLERADNVARMLDVKYHFLLPRLEDIGGADRPAANGQRCCAARRRWRLIAEHTAMRSGSIA